MCRCYKGAGSKEERTGPTDHIVVAVFNGGEGQHNEEGDGRRIPGNGRDLRYKLKGRVILYPPPRPGSPVIS